MTSHDGSERPVGRQRDGTEGLAAIRPASVDPTCKHPVNAFRYANLHKVQSRVHRTPWLLLSSQQQQQASRMQTWTYVTSAVEAEDALCRACTSTVRNPPAAHARHHQGHEWVHTQPYCPRTTQPTPLKTAYQSASLRACTSTQPTCPPAYLPTHDAITYVPRASPSLNQPPKPLPPARQPHRSFITINRCPQGTVDALQSRI